MSKWPRVKLSQVLRLDLNPVPVDAITSYPMVGVLSFGRGLFDREPIENGKTSYRQFYRLKADHVVMSQLFGWEGALALSTEKFAGKFLSPQFPTFLCDENQLDRNYLGWVMRRPAFWEDLGSRASGMGDRRRTLNPEALFACEIPLPPLPEQRRIVARIEALAAKIEEAQDLRQQAAEEAEALFNSYLTSKFYNTSWPMQFLPDVAQIARGKFSHRPRNEPRFYGGKFPFIQIGDISSANRYIQNHSQTLNEQGLAISRMFPAGTIVIAITGATIGATGILTFDSCFPDSIVGIQANPQLVTSEFIYLAVEQVKKTALAEATQTTQPNINLGNLEKLRIPIPPLPEQHHIVSECDASHAKVDALKKLQVETTAELAALLSSVLDKAFKGEL